VSRPRASRTLENSIRRYGYVHVAGVDEVGRGCLAGPVVAGAVILQPDHYVPGVADSKVLTAADRECLFDDICGAAVAWHVSIVPPAEIDRINIHRASLQAMRDAIMALVPLPSFVLVDGFRVPELMMPQRPVIGGDRRSTAIAAASILAKVTRDRLMREEAEHHPWWWFDQNKGYPCPRHQAALRGMGPSAIHRRSWVFMDSLPWTGIVRYARPDPQGSLFDCE
jgi:ribonuclease HII